MAKAYWQDSLDAGTLTDSEYRQLRWQLDRMDGGTTLADAAKVFDELEGEESA